jgi:hypothetical protein
VKQRGLNTLGDIPQLGSGRTPASRIVVARLGTYKDPRYGTFQITEKDFEGWSTNLRDTFGGRVSIDYDHSSDRGKGTRAAGWIVGLERQGKDVIADVEWTPRGAKAIRDGSYKFISPTYTSHYTDETGTDRGRALVGAATTNRPVLRRGMPTLTLSRDAKKELAKTMKKRNKKKLARKKAKKLARKKANKAVALTIDGRHVKAKQLARPGKKLRRHLKTLGQVSPGLSPGSNWGDPTAVQAAGAGRVPPGLDNDGLLLHATIARNAGNGSHYFDAMSQVTGNPSYARLSDIPPAVIEDQPGLLTGIDSEQASLYSGARALAVAAGIGWMDALSIIEEQRELVALEADDGSAPVDWLDSTERPSPPRPYGQGAAEDWERDKRRAAAAGVEIDHAAWQAGAELGVDAVGKLADAQRADRIAALRERSGGALEAARQREDDRRTSAINDELVSRAKHRTQQADRAARQAAQPNNQPYYRPAL